MGLVGLLNDEAYIAASRVLHPASVWFVWAGRILLFLGSALVLVGIIFFFAYNWSAMGRFLKFGLIEAGIAVAVTASYWRGRNRLSGKVLLLSASVLVGVLLAVYGQTYQTGADAFELFIGWAVLIVGWVLLSEFAALWIIWLILLNTGAILYWFQVAEPCHSIRYEFLCLTMAALNGFALTLRENGVQRGLIWLNGTWLRGVLLTASLAALSLPTIHLIVDYNSTEGVSLLSALAWLMAAGGGYLCYRYKLRDMIPLAIIVMNACLILLILVGNAMFHDTSFNEAGSFILFSLIILVVATGAAFWLKRIVAAMAKEMKEAAL